MPRRAAGARASSLNASDEERTVGTDMTLVRTLGCAALTVLALGACSDPVGPECACGAGQFCCLGTCQPLGTTCGAIDGGATDGHVADGGGLDGGFDAGGPVCASPCNVGYECIEWADFSTGASHADCLPPGSVACDPSASPPRCDGATRVVCDPYGGFPESGPPGLERREDCRGEFGPSASCALAPDATGQCTGTSCDPATYASRCDAARADVMLSCDATRGLVRFTTCLPEWRCLANEWTVATGGATCIPRIAVPTDGTATSEWTPLACDGTDAIHVEQYGYEWSERCRTGEACFTFPPAVGGAPARCLPASTRTCDPATFVPTCDAAATSEQQCVLGVVTPRYCGIGLVSGSIPSACDETLGACVPTGSCSPTGYTPRCTADGRFRLTCNTDWVRELAERCACTTGPTGGAVCG